MPVSDIESRSGDVSPDAPPRDAPPRVGSSAYLFSTGMVAVAAGISFLIQQIVALPNLSLVFLTAVLFSALRYGLWPSIYASLLSVAVYNFFFLPPLYTFTIADPANVLSLVFFLVVALIVSNLTAQKQRQAERVAVRAKLTADLYGFSRKIAGIGSLEDLLWVVTHQIAAMLKCDVVLLLPDADGLRVRAGYPPEDRLDEADMAAAEWTRANDRAAGHGADTLPGGRRLFLPLKTQAGPVGVVGIQREQPPVGDERRLLDALLDQAAVAVERARLADDVDRVRLQAETERLRNALLTSISHDLRTPLASIIGGLSSLKSYGETYDARTRLDLVSTAHDEAERLNRFVGNLLDMTRLEAGAIRPRLEAIDIGEVVGVALGRAQPLLSRHKPEVDLPEDLPMVKADFVLLEQVFFNLLDNAAKYTPQDSGIRIAGYSSGESVTLEVIDEGAGIPSRSADAIFEKFTRLEAGDRTRAGTGLGLAICRGFVEAMGGSVTAGNRQDRSGAVFTITLMAADSVGAPQEVAHVG